MKKKCIVCLAICLLVLSTIAFASPIKEIIYTKKTSLVYPATYVFRFSLWDDEVSTDEGVNMLWSDPNIVLPLSGPKITYALGSNTPLDGVDFSQQLWVQVEKWNKKKSAWKPVGKRDQLGVVPYALWSEKSDVSASFDIGAIVSGTLPISSGGTGATTASGARGNIGAAAIGANNDITSLLGLLIPLTIAQGGTGSNTQNFVDLTTDQSVGGTKTFSDPISSIVTTGRAPLQVLSTSMVNNLNAEMLGGLKLADLDARYGSVTQEIKPMTNIITTIDSAGDVGYYTSIVIGVDGFPVISYYDASNGDLKVAKCNNASCSSATITAVDTAGNVGADTSITIGTDGFPVISYYDISKRDLKVAKCNNASCSSATITAVDTAGNVGWNTSITIATDGFPVISYFDASNADLKIAKCNDASCTSATTTTVDSAGAVGYYASTTIGTNGFPVISYYDIINADLKIAKCNDASCTSAAITSIDTVGDTGHYTSITIGTNGLPVISYTDWGNGDLKIATCNDASCSSAATTAVDSAGDVGDYTSITIGTDGLPVISYYDMSNADLKIAKCNDASCSSAAITAVDSAGDVGSETSITIGMDGLPVISYHDTSNGDLKVVKCASEYCLNNWRRR